MSVFYEQINDDDDDVSSRFVLHILVRRLMHWVLQWTNVSSVSKSKCVSSVVWVCDYQISDLKVWRKFIDFVSFCVI